MAGGWRGCLVVAGGKEHSGGGTGVEASEQKRETITRRESFAESCVWLLKFKQWPTLLLEF